MDMFKKPNKYHKFDMLVSNLSPSRFSKSTKSKTDDHRMGHITDLVEVPATNSSHGRIIRSRP